MHTLGCCCYHGGGEGPGWLQAFTYSRIWDSSSLGRSDGFLISETEKPVTRHLALIASFSVLVAAAAHLVYQYLLYSEQVIHALMFR